MHRRPTGSSFPPELLERVFVALGVHPRDLQEIGRTSQSVQEAQERLDALKAVAKKGYRKAAHANHPDKHGDDPEKVEFFKALSEQWAALSEVEIAQRPPPPPVQRARWRPMSSSVFYSTGSATSSANGWGGWGPGNVTVHIVF